MVLHARSDADRILGETMKLSIVIPILNSHEIVRRQCLHFQKMNLDPEVVELIFVDDGSNPPLKTLEIAKLPNLTIIETNDTRPWTWALARNAGARVAQGEYLLMADLDYIIPKDAIESALELKEDRMNFRREFGVIDSEGNTTQDIEVLRLYGLTEKRIEDRGVRVSAHTNEFVIRKSVFFDLGCYREDLVRKAYPQGEDRCFHGVWIRAMARGEVNRTFYRPLIYMFPNGRFCGDIDHNPFGLFHATSRKKVASINA